MFSIIAKADKMRVTSLARPLASSSHPALSRNLVTVDKQVLVVNSVWQMSQERASVGANTLRVSPHSGEAAKLMGSRARKRVMAEQRQANPPTSDLYVTERHKHRHARLAPQTRTAGYTRHGRERKQTFTHKARPLSSRQRCGKRGRTVVGDIALQ